MNHVRRHPQRGSAMLVTLIIIAALIAGAAALVTTQLASTRSTGLTRNGITALYCAEAGLSAARDVVATGHSNWDASLAASFGGDHTEPLWISSGITTHDLDGDGTADFHVYLVDNDDEQPTPNPAADFDFQVFIVSVCDKYPETPKEIRELVQFNGGTQCYHSQQGGCNQVNNDN